MVHQAGTRIHENHTYRLPASSFGIRVIRGAFRRAEGAGLSGSGWVYAKNYALYGWKRDVLHFDLFDIQPWLDRIAKSKGDLAFYEICAEYVASLNDVHSTFLLPSNFRADLGFRVDIYDGKVLIDEVDRDVLAVEDFPFDIGDELVSVEGVASDDIIADASRFLAFGNARSTKLYSAFSVTVRDQVVHPRAVEVGESAAIVVRRQDGTLENYKVP